MNNEEKIEVISKHLKAQRGVAKCKIRGIDDTIYVLVYPRRNSPDIIARILGATSRCFLTQIGLNPSDFKFTILGK